MVSSLRQKCFQLLFACSKARVLSSELFYFSVHVACFAYIDINKMQIMHESRNDTLNAVQLLCLLVNSYRRWRNCDVVAKRVVSCRQLNNILF